MNTSRSRSVSAARPLFTRSASVRAAPARVRSSPAPATSTSSTSSSSRYRTSSWPETSRSKSRNALSTLLADGTWRTAVTVASTALAAAVTWSS